MLWRNGGMNYKSKKVLITFVLICTIIFTSTSISYAHIAPSGILYEPEDRTKHLHYTDWAILEDLNEVHSGTNEITYCLSPTFDSFWQGGEEYIFSYLASAFESAANNWNTCYFTDNTETTYFSVREDNITPIVNVQPCYNTFDDSDIATTSFQYYDRTII